MPFFNAADHAMPLIGLITGHVNLKHPLVVRLVEAAVLGLASGALTLFVGMKFLEKDLASEKARLDAHLVRYEAQLLKRDAEIARNRLEQQAGIDLVVRKLERIEDCIRVRSCTR